MADTSNSRDINKATTISGVDNNDKIFISDGGTALRSVSLYNLAKAIIEQYNGTTLEGSGKSISTAVNDMHSRIMSLESGVTARLG